MTNEKKTIINWLCDCKGNDYFPECKMQTCPYRCKADRLPEEMGGCGKCYRYNAFLRNGSK